MTDAQWGAARDRTDGRTRLRMVIALAAILLAVLAGLALLDSFTVDYAPGPPQAEPGGADEGAASESSGAGPECQTFERSFFWLYVGLAAAAAVLFAVAVARRAHHDGRIGSSIWGILSIVTLFLAIMAFGAWRIMRAICAGALTCGSANDGTYTSFLFLLGLTLVALGIGIALSHRQRRQFLATGWGLLGLLMYLPTVLTGFTWFLIRTFCTPDLSCATRDAFLVDLGTIFWLSLLGAAITTGIAIFVQRRFAHGAFRSGWGIVAILLALLAVAAGSGWLFVDGMTIPGCDPIEEPEFEEEPEEPPTCVELRDQVQGRLSTGILIAALIVIGSSIAGAVLNRHDLKRFWTSPWAIVAYVGLALLLLLGLGYLLAGSMCDQAEEQQGERGEGSGTDGGNGGSDGGGTGGDGGGTGGGGGGGGGGTGGSGDGTGAGPGSGPGGGGGGTGDSPALTPVEIDPSSLTWLLVAILVMIGLAALFVLLRFRKDKELGEAGAAPPDAEAVRARERQDLLAMLSSGRLATDEAVIASYRAFVSWATGRGLGLAATETPREHARRVGERYAIPPESMQAFIRAYEVARLSPHQPTSGERDAAVRFTQDLSQTRPTPRAPAQEDRP